MKNLLRLKNRKFHIAPEHREVISEQQVREVFDETLRRLDWKYGKGWENSCSEKEMIKIFVNKSKEVAEDYLNRKVREKAIKKLTEGLMAIRDKELRKKT